MKIKGDPQLIAQYQKALGGRGIVTFEGHQPHLFKDSRWGKNWAPYFEKKRLPRRMPKGIRHEYAEWKKRLTLYEEKFLEMLS